MVKDSVTLYKGLILKDLCVVVPLTLKFEILNILHQGHKNSADKIMWPKYSLLARNK